MATNTGNGFVADYETERELSAVAFHLRVLLRRSAVADVDRPTHRDAESKRNPPREMPSMPR